MDRGIFPYWSGDKRVLAKIREKRQLLLVFQAREQWGLHSFLMPKQLSKRELPPLEHASVDRRPLRKHDIAGPFTNRFQRQRVAPDDVPFKNEPHGLAALVFRGGLEQAPVGRVEYFEEPSAAIADIVRQNINPVDRGDGQDGITLEVQLRLAVALLYNRQFAFQNRGQEVPVTTCGLKETGVDSFRFLL